MKIGFMVGSFNPWHEGHADVATKALQIFDRIVVIQMTNTSKDAKRPTPVPQRLDHYLLKDWDEGRLVTLRRENMSITTAIGNYLLGDKDIEKNQYAIVRGLRNERDFCEEQILQYHYEDLGIKCPLVYIISDRRLVHISSSAIRAIQKFTE